MSEYYAVPSITRYFDHIQSESAIRTSIASLGDAFEVIALDIDHAPKTERKVEAPKKKAPKAPAAEAQPVPATPAAEPTTSTTEPAEKSQKKEKKKGAAGEGAAKDKKAGGKAAAKAPADDGEPAPSMIDLRVGHIVDSKKSLQLFQIKNLLV